MKKTGEYSTHIHSNFYAHKRKNTIYMYTFYETSLSYDEVAVSFYGDVPDNGEASIAWWSVEG